MTIGAFYQCWKHSAATIQVIKQFRIFYPESTVYLVSDDGHDYSPLAKKYDCIYEQGTVNTKAALFYSLDEIRVYFERLTRALNEIKDEWCMLLEDDVCINGKYDEKCDIWSAGIIMHMLLVGNHPFDGVSDNDIYDKIEEGKIDLSGNLW
jgi:serine/threonine protein kinase